jgi:hypothetical protein
MRTSQTNKDNALARSAAANEARRARGPQIIDWDEAIARWLDMLDEIYSR